MVERYESSQPRRCLHPGRRKIRASEELSNPTLVHAAGLGTPTARQSYSGSVGINASN